MIVTYPVSISLSQLGLVLAIFGWILNNIFGPRQPSKKQTGITFDIQALVKKWSTKSEIFPRIIMMAFLCYLVQIISVFYLAFGSESFFAELFRMLKSEPKDILLMSAALWVISFTRTQAGRKDVLKWLKWAIYILVITGAISIWSRHRLYKLPWLIMNDWQVGPHVRYQHHLGTFNLKIFSLHFYMPIGLMNTHLTYAGLLMLAFPMLVLKVLDPYIKSPRLFLTIPELKKHCLDLLLLITASLIFILNNGRSAMVGAMLASLAGITYFGIVYWKSKSKNLIPLLFIMVLGLGLFSKTAPMIHPRLARAVNALFGGKKKHTDHQRNLIWNGSLEMIQKSPIWGVGPGNYERSLQNHIIQYSQKHPHLWTFYSLAQRGHAHNDYLHLLTIAGPFSLIFYLVFFAMLVFIIFKRMPAPLEYWKFAPLTIFIAGFLQCYFQDDEILLPFWIYTGLIIATVINSPDQNETLN